MTLTVEVADEVAARRRPTADAVVALESTIFSNLGLPAPANAEALARCLAAIRQAGAVPAITAVLDGRARVGLGEHEHERILGAARKTAERDVGVAVAQQWPFGATTVSAALALADRAGIKVFATGGIGGVHRGVEVTGDVSADLDALARHPLVTVCAGAKAFLDLRPHARGARGHRRAGARVPPRPVPGLLHPFVGPAGAPPGRGGRRGRRRAGATGLAPTRACC